jgi:general secretion pathway protein I
MSLLLASIDTPMDCATTPRARHKSPSGSEYMRWAQHQAGFTLLEVLVALGIAATALVSLYTLAGQLLKGSAALDERQAALWCADNQLVTVFLNQYAPPLGNTQTQCQQRGRAYVVKQFITATPNPLFRRIELSVFLNDNPAASASSGAKSASEAANAAASANPVTAEAASSSNSASEQRLAFLATVIPQDAGAP